MLRKKEIARVAATQITPILDMESSDFLLGKLRHQVALVFDPASDEGGIIVDTAPLKLNTTLDVLSISHLDSLEQVGMIDCTDSICSDAAVDSLYVGLSFNHQTSVYRVPASRLTQRALPLAPRGDNPRELELSYAGQLDLDANAYQIIDGEPVHECPLLIGAPLELPHRHLYIDVQLHITLNLQTATLNSAGRAFEVKFRDLNGDAFLVPDMEVELLGFDIDTHRINLNRRPAPTFEVKERYGLPPAEFEAKFNGLAERNAKRDAYIAQLSGAMDTFLSGLPILPGMKIQIEEMKAQLLGQYLRQYDELARQQLAYYDPRHVGASGTELTDHVVEGEKTKLVLRVGDEPGPGNGNHRYVISGFDSATNVSEIEGYRSTACEVLFQNGTIPERGLNGVTAEVLLAIIAHRLQGFQNGPFASAANQKALEHTKNALEALKDRTRDRMRRQVEGQHKA